MDNVVLERHLKRFQITANIFSLAIGILTALGVCYGFYYNTTAKLDNHTEQIEAVEVKIDELSASVTTSAVYQGASKEQIKALENQVNDVKKGQDRIEDKLDRLIMQSK
jgi:hypothetical protein